MNVLVLQSELGVLRGGGENFTRNLFAAFAARGHRVTAAFIADRNGKYQFPLPPSIETVPIPGWWSRKLGQATLSAVGSRLPFHSPLRLEWDRIQEAICWRAIRWHDRRFHNRVAHEFSRRWDEFDAIYVHGNVLLASEIAKHRPTILRLPGPVSPQFAAALRSIQAVCANGDVLTSIRKILGQRAFELPVGLETSQFSRGNTSVRTALGWTKEHYVIGYVGRLTHLKGVDLLAAAFRAVTSSMDNARLLIVGNGEYKRKISSLLARESVRKMVHIEPDVSPAKLPEWYRAMDIFVMPSRYENFSNAVLEAMACGVPFLLSNVGGNKSLSATEAGWFFDPESVSSLTARLIGVHGTQSQMKRKGENGSRYVTQQYSWVNSAAKLEELISSGIGVRVHR